MVISGAHLLHEDWCPTRVSACSSPVLLLYLLSWWGHFLRWVFMALLCWWHTSANSSSPSFLPSLDTHLTVWISFGERADGRSLAEIKSQHDWAAVYPGRCSPTSGSCDLQITLSERKHRPGVVLDYPLPVKCQTANLTQSCRVFFYYYYQQFYNIRSIQPFLSGVSSVILVISRLNYSSLLAGLCTTRLVLISLLLCSLLWEKDQQPSTWRNLSDPALHHAHFEFLAWLAWIHHPSR